MKPNVIRERSTFLRRLGDAAVEDRRREVVEECEPTQGPAPARAPSADKPAVVQTQVSPSLFQPIPLRGPMKGGKIA